MTAIESALLRITAITPVHCGSGTGEGETHRRLQRDQFSSLPLLPDSSLKGVLAGQHGNINDDKENARRESKFGSPDRGFEGDKLRKGKPSPIVFGDGQLLCFPLLDRGGDRFWIFPVAAIARALTDDPKSNDHSDALNLLGMIEADERASLCLAFDGWPDVEALLEARPLRGATASRSAGQVLAACQGLAGPDPRANSVILPQERAARLWDQAAETRTLTALDSQRGTVRQGSLRTCEMIPSGSVFISLASSELPDWESEVTGRIQIGGGRNQGFGWINLEQVDLTERSGGLQIQPHLLAKRPEMMIDDAETLVRMHSAIRSLRGASQESKDKLWSVVTAFGPRVKQSGLAAAVAFALAKAKCSSPEPKLDMQVHRWLLKTLLGLRASQIDVDGRDETLLQWISKSPFSGESFDTGRKTIMARWAWLRRFSELGLKDWRPEA